MKKWINYLVSGAMYSLLAIVLIFTITSKIQGGTPNIFGHEILTVLSGSMEPGIKTGSLITITPVEDVSSLQKGDVITYRSVDNQQIFITHRIVDIKVIDSQLHFITEGDNNNAVDPSPVPASHVRGQYTGLTILYLGYLFSFVKSKMGIVALVILPGVVMVLWQMISLWQTITRMDDKQAGPEDTSSAN